MRLAAGTNNNEQIERLLANGANPNAADEHKRTALHIAAAKGYANCVESLLKGGSQPNQKVIKDTWVVFKSELALLVQASLQITYDGYYY